MRMMKIWQEGFKIVEIKRKKKDIRDERNTEQKENQERL